MSWTELADRLFRTYYAVKFAPFRRERRLRRRGGNDRGFVGIQIDGLAYSHLMQALARGYLPHLEDHLQRGYVLREFQAGLPSTTPAAQACIFYGEDGGIPAFRWFEKESGRLITCNDPDHVQYFREKLFGGRPGLLDEGSSYSNILDGGAERSVFTVSSPRPQTLFGRFGGGRLVLLLLLNPLRACRMAAATLLEYVTHRLDRRRLRRNREPMVGEGLFPFIRIFCNVILRELQTFGVIADIYCGVPCIYTTFSGYDELAHHFGPASRPALKNLKYTDKRIGEIMRMLRHAPGAGYELIILSDHGQTPGIPFQKRYGATLGEAVSAFLQESEPAAVSSGPLEFSRIQLGYLREELETHPSGLRHKLFRGIKDHLQRKIGDLVPETMKVDEVGGVVVTYSSSLAHLYITGERRRLALEEVEEQQPLLLRFLRRHQGIGFLGAVDSLGRVRLLHRDGSVLLGDAEDRPWSELGFLDRYGDPRRLVPEIERYVRGPFCGDLVLFGAYDGRTIVCFDDQLGGHGTVGGEQQRPFLILPTGHPLLARRRLFGYGFLHDELFAPLRRSGPGEPASLTPQAEGCGISG